MPRAWPGRNRTDPNTTDHRPRECPDVRELVFDAKRLPGGQECCFLKHPGFVSSLCRAKIPYPLVCRGRVGVQRECHQHRDFASGLFQCRDFFTLKFSQRYRLRQLRRVFFPPLFPAWRPRVGAVLPKSAESPGDPVMRFVPPEFGPGSGSIRKALHMGEAWGSWGRKMTRFGGTSGPDEGFKRYDLLGVRRPSIMKFKEQSRWMNLLKSRVLSGSEQPCSRNASAF